MTPVEAINLSYKNIMEKDADAICDGYFNSDELYVILEGPRLSNRGHANISKGWRDFCLSGITMKSIEWTEGPYCEEQDGMAWVGGIIKLTVAVADKIITKIFRATFVLTRQNGHWKIKHEHVSAAQEDPYGIGDWLKQ